MPRPLVELGGSFKLLSSDALHRQSRWLDNLSTKPGLLISLVDDVVKQMYNALTKIESISNKDLV